MPYIQSDGACLYYEAAGTGTPIVFVHEFSGDLWSWEKQIQHFSRHYRCVAFNARGYPPSDAPESPSCFVAMSSEARITVSGAMSTPAVRAFAVNHEANHCVSGFKPSKPSTSRKLGRQATLSKLT